MIQLKISHTVRNHILCVITLLLTSDTTAYDSGKTAIEIRQTEYLLGNIRALSYNPYCRRQAINITYYEYLSLYLPACKAHAPHSVICCVSGCTTVSHISS
jgi:hypothetical protein